MIETTASVHWQGPGRKGLGQISPETGAHQAVQRGLEGLCTMLKTQLAAALVR